MSMPDYSNYSYEELLDILDRIQKDKYPEKVKAINEQLVIKKEDYKPKEKFVFIDGSKIQYKSKSFILILVIYLTLISLTNSLNIYLEQPLISFIILPLLLVTLTLIILGHRKVSIAIKGISIVFFLLGGFSVLAVIFELLKFILSTSEEYTFGLNLSKIIPSLIMFGIGVFYFWNVDEYLTKSNKNQKVAKPPK